MKLPGIFGQLLEKKSEHDAPFVSLYLDVYSVSAAAWSLDERGQVALLGTETYTFTHDSWEERIDATDRIFAFLEEKTHSTQLKKTILGLPPAYLTESGDIQKEARAQIKILMHELELTPMGFVPIHQALMYKMKKEEGVPPSVILLGVNATSITIFLYKIGTLIGFRVVERRADIALCVEEGIKSFTGQEVLPARMLLYGSTAADLETVRGDLMHHTWTTRLNFLHFPKIETVTADLTIQAISLAGASELGLPVAMDGAIEEQESVETAPATHQTIAQPPPAPTVEEKIEAISQSQEEITDESTTSDELTSEGDEETEEDEEGLLGESDKSDDVIEAEVVAAQKVISEDVGPTPMDDNVVMVNPESLGFKQDIDILEHPPSIQKQESEDAPSDFPRKSLSLPSLGALGQRKKLIVLAAVFGIFLFLCGFLYWLLPQATVTVLTSPKDIETSQQITIDPTATIVDAQNKILPGHAQQKSVSGDNTVPVTGKKKVGTSAKGTLTIYNKSVSSLVLKRGAVLVSNGLNFTIDNDIVVASASENMTGDSLTFGKQDTQITAAAIGSESNLAANSDFSFRDLDSTIASARNNAAFSGGASHDATVVTRADYDAFIKTMSDQLVGQAKQNLSEAVAGNEKLIDGTIKTTVTEKVFSQEIDQEATQLQGKITISITGISYSDDDIRALLTSVTGDMVPAGYTLAPARTSISLGGVTVAKNGKISATAMLHSQAVPTLDANAIQQAITGKSLTSAQLYLKGLTGVAGMEVSFRLNPFQGRLPMNKRNIKVLFAIHE